MTTIQNKLDRFIIVMEKNVKTNKWGQVNNNDAKVYGIRSTAIKKENESEE